MTAREVVAALNGRWHGFYGMACCPVHEDREPSLSISDGNDGRLLVHCFAGCDATDVLRAINGRGLGERPAEPVARVPDRDNGPLALEIWHSARRTAGTLAEDYLRGRGITIPVPPSLRYHPGLCHAQTGLILPALIAAVQGPDRRIVAVQRVFLNEYGRKATVSTPKMSLGPLGAGAVRLAHAGPVLGLAEGVEDALAAMQTTGTPCWAVLGGNRLRRVELPPEVAEVSIFSDGDAAGREAAEKAVRHYRREGRKARAFLPPGGAEDFAAFLTMEGRECA